MMKTVREIAEQFGVSIPSVRYWLNRGLPYDTEKVIGVRERKIIDPEVAITFLKLSEHEAERIRKAGD